jgi:hypothetical protein
VDEDGRGKEKESGKANDDHGKGRCAAREILE